MPAASGRTARRARGAAALAAGSSAAKRAHDDAAQLRLESDRDLVQVVTIHKSKGLEYGIVFCPMLWDGASAHAGAAAKVWSTTTMTATR